MTTTTDFNNKKGLKEVLTEMVFDAHEVGNYGWVMTDEEVDEVIKAKAHHGTDYYTTVLSYFVIDDKQHNLIGSYYSTLDSAGYFGNESDMVNNLSSHGFECDSFAEAERKFDSHTVAYYPKEWTDEPLVDVDYRKELTIALTEWFIFASEPDVKDDWALTDDEVTHIFNKQVNSVQHLNLHDLMNEGYRLSYKSGRIMDEGYIINDGDAHAIDEAEAVEILNAMGFEGASYNEIDANEGGKLDEQCYWTAWEC